VIEWYHGMLSNGHRGVVATMRRMNHLHITNLKEKVKKIIARCEECQRKNWKKERKAVGEHTVPGFPFETVAMDFIVLPQTVRGNKYALVMVDYFSNVTRVYPCVEQNADSVIACVKDWISIYGAPRVLLSDRGTPFIADVVRQLVQDMLGIDHRLSTPYHPACNGKVERMNREVKNMFRSLGELRGMDWDIALPWAVWIINSTPISRIGLSPYHIAFGRQPQMPDDLVIRRGFGDVDEHVAALRRNFPKVRKIVMGALKSARMAYMEESPIRFDVGDDVWFYIPTEGINAQMKVPFRGPVKVLEKVSDTTYLLDVDGSGVGQRFNVENIRAYDPNVEPAEERNVKKRSKQARKKEKKNSAPSGKRRKRRTNNTMPGDYAD